MKKLLKEYEISSDMQYYEMIAESFLNGQISQANSEFIAMPKRSRRDMIKAIVSGRWNSGLGNYRVLCLIDFI